MLPATSHRTAPPADLWTRLEAFDLDATGASLPFSQRLARDNGWSPAFARRVVLEYKRFLYLAATCGHPVTPSDEVDQAWHLHLVYTRSYWDELCGQVLGFALHHGPTKGGAAEGHKFEDWYALTLASYHAAFGTLPPPDVWPPAAQRFGDAPYFRRVNLRRHWLLPRLNWPFGRPGRREALGLLTVLLLGCTARTPLNPLNWYGTEFLGLFATLCVVLLPLSVWWRNRLAGPFDEYVGEPLSTYEAARLAGQGRRVGQSVVAALVHDNTAELRLERKIRRTAAVAPVDTYELAVWQLIDANGDTDLDNLCKKAMSHSFSEVQKLDQSLIEKGLLLDVEERARFNLIPTLTTVGLALFGVTKMLVGLGRNRPVGFLIILLLLLVTVAWGYLNMNGSWASRRGQRLLASLGSAVKDERRQRPFSGRVVALTVALFGIDDLKNIGHVRLANYLAPPPTDNGGDGGSGCGGGGCGGGGCGGCGS